MNLIEAVIFNRSRRRKYKHNGEFKLTICEYTLDYVCGSKSGDNLWSKNSHNNILYDNKKFENNGEYIRIMRTKNFVNDKDNKVTVTLNGELIENIATIPYLFKECLYANSRHRPARSATHRELLYIINYVLTKYITTARMEENFIKQYNNGHISELNDTEQYINKEGICPDAKILSRQYIDNDYGNANPVDLWIIEASLLAWQLIEIHVSIGTEKVEYHTINIGINDLNNIVGILARYKHYDNKNYEIKKIIGSNEIEFTNSQSESVYMSFRADRFLAKDQSEDKNVEIYNWIKRTCLEQVYEKLPHLIRKYTQNTIISKYLSKIIIDYMIE
jgi:hypothetical protein